MQEKVIAKLMHDEEFDPSVWVLDAIQMYVKSNPAKLISDITTRKYIFEAMEHNDLESLAAAIAKIDNDRDKVIFEFLEAACKNGGEFDYHLNWALRRLEDAVTDRKTYAGHLAKLKKCDKYPWLDDMGYQSLLEALQNWNLSELTKNQWIEYLGRLEDGDLMEYLDKHFFGKIDNYTNDERDILKIQDLLIRVTRLLPDDCIERWWEILKAKSLYTAYLSDYVKRMRSGGEKYHVKINDLLCRCGKSTRSASGLGNHRRVCGKGQELSVIALARTRVAKVNSDLLICTGCGKVCKSKSGLTHHHKKCERFVNELQVNSSEASPIN